MKTSHDHRYHGICLSNGAWRVQIRLLDKYRSIRTFATSPEEAARCHDITMKRLEPFLSPSLEPNFPDDYDNLDMAPWMTNGERLDNPADSEFRDTLHELEEKLIREARDEGFDLETLASHYRSERRFLRERAQRKLESAHQSRYSRAVESVRRIVGTLDGQQEWLAKMVTNLPHSETDSEAKRAVFTAFDQTRTQLLNYLSVLEKTKS